MDVVSIGPIEADVSAVREHFQSAAGQLAGRKLGFVYLPHDVETAPLLRAAREGLGDHVVGATTGGIAFTERGITRTGVVAGVFGGLDFDYAISVARNLSQEDTSGISTACSELVAAARKHVPRTPALLALGDGRSVDGVALSDMVSRLTPPHWRIFGGVAGDSLDFAAGSRVFVDDEVLDAAAVLVGLFDERSCGVAVGHGWSAVEGAQDLVVTGISGHRLEELDGRPAATVYGEELVRLGLISDAATLLPDASRFALGAKTRFGELTIRAALGFPGDGAITLAGGITPGSVLQVVSTTVERLAASAAEVGRRSVADFTDGRRPRGGVVFDCAARVAYLGDAYKEHVAGFFAGHAFPIIGTTSYGEIAKFGGSLEGFHNATAVMAAW